MKPTNQTKLKIAAILMALAFVIATPTHAMGTKETKVQTQQTNPDAGLSIEELRKKYPIDWFEKKYGPLCGWPEDNVEFYRACNKEKKAGIKSGKYIELGYKEKDIKEFSRGLTKEETISVFVVDISRVYFRFNMIEPELIKQMSGVNAGKEHKKAREVVFQRKMMLGMWSRAVNEIPKDVEGAREEVLRRVKEDGSALMYFTNYKDDEEVVREAMGENLYALEYASERIKDREELVLKVVRINLDFNYDNNSTWQKMSKEELIQKKYKFSQSMLLGRMGSKRLQEKFKKIQAKEFIELIEKTKG